jgi:hypothetical protein
MAAKDPAQRSWKSEFSLERFAGWALPLVTIFLLLGALAEAVRARQLQWASAGIAEARAEQASNSGESFFLFGEPTPGRGAAAGFRMAVRRVRRMVFPLSGSDGSSAGMLLGGAARRTVVGCLRRNRLCGLLSAVDRLVAQSVSAAIDGRGDAIPIEYIAEAERLWRKL